MDVQRVTHASVDRGDHARVTVVDVPDVADERLIQDRVDDLAVRETDAAAEVVRGAAGLSLGSRLVLALGLLLGMAAAARWVWVMGANGVRYGPATWTVWLLLLGGPLVVASSRLAQLWRSLRDGAA